MTEHQSENFECPPQELRGLTLIGQSGQHFQQAPPPSLASAQIRFAPNISERVQK